MEKQVPSPVYSSSSQTKSVSQRLLAVHLYKSLFKMDAPPCFGTLATFTVPQGTVHYGVPLQTHDGGRLSGRTCGIYSCEFLSPRVIVLKSSDTLVSSLENEHSLLKIK